MTLLFIDLEPVLVLIVLPFLLRSERSILSGRDAHTLVLGLVNNVPLNIVAFSYLPVPRVLILFNLHLLSSDVARLYDLLEFNCVRIQSD